MLKQAVLIRALRPTHSEMLVDLRRHRRWYDDNPPAGDGDNPPTNPPTGTPPDKKGGKGGDGNGDAKSYTQEELDKLFTERVTRAKDTTLKELFAELGVTDKDTLANMLKSAKDAEDAKLSEIEKANKRAEEAEAKARQFEDALKAEAEQRRKDVLHNAVTLAAQNAKANDPVDVLMWLQVNHTDDLTKAIGDDGKVDAKHIETLVGKAKAAKPYLFDGGRGRHSPGSPSNSDGRVSEPDKDEKAKAQQATRRQIRRSF